MVSDKLPIDPFLDATPASSDLITDAALSPSIIRDSISWLTGSSGDVEIGFDIHNPSGNRTDPETFIVEAASFGAFIPTVPVTAVRVGALDPGERTRITASVTRDALDEASRQTQPQMPDGPAVSLLNRRSRAAEWTGNLNIYSEATLISSIGHLISKRHVEPVSAP